MDLGFGPQARTKHTSDYTFQTYQALTSFGKGDRIRFTSHINSSSRYVSMSDVLPLSSISSRGYPFFSSCVILRHLAVISFLISSSDGFIPRFSKSLVISLPCSLEKDEGGNPLKLLCTIFLWKRNAIGRPSESLYDIFRRLTSICKSHTTSTRLILIAALNTTSRGVRTTWTLTWT